MRNDQTGRLPAFREESGRIPEDEKSLASRGANEESM